MIPSLRLIRLLAAGSALWLLAALTPGGWVAGAAFLLLLTLLCLQDIVRAPHAAQLGVSRLLPARLALGEEYRIEVALENRTLEPLKVRVRDELPAVLAGCASLPDVEIPAHGQTMCPYAVRTVARGADEFGRVILRVQHGLGLVLREVAVAVPGRVKVYPRFRGVDDFDLLARIDRRDEIVRRPRRAPGSGTDFESLRPYLPGEDLRHIDWKATARRGALISRNQRVEKGQQLAVLLDAGRLMAEAIEQVSRLDHAMNAAIMLGHAVARRGDALAAACFSNRIESFLPPVRGPALVPRLLETLYHVQARPLESDYWQIIAEVLGRLRRRSLVIMLTDVMDALGSAGLLNNLKRAVTKHLVLCVVLKDPELHAVANGSPAGLAQTYRKAAACDVLRRRRLALERMRAGGIMVLEAEPGRLSVQLVRRYLEIRQANLQ